MNLETSQDCTMFFIVFCIIFIILYLSACAKNGKLTGKLRQINESLTDEIRITAILRDHRDILHKELESRARTINSMLSKITYYENVYGKLGQQLDNFSNRQRDKGGTTECGIDRSKMAPFIDPSLGEPYISNRELRKGLLKLQEYISDKMGIDLSSNDIPNKWSLSREVWKLHQDELERNSQLLKEWMEKSFNPAKEKIPNTKHTSTCLQKAKDDEPIFVLLATDSTATKAIGAWISANYDRQPEEKIKEARMVIKQMIEWRAKQPKPSGHITFGASGTPQKLRSLPAITRVYDEYTGNFLDVVCCNRCCCKYVNHKPNQKCPECGYTN